MGNRIAVMKDGKIQQVGTPLELYDRPANLFVANFIGTPPMNFFKATVEDGGATLAAATFRIPAPSAARAVLAPRTGKQVVVGVRPENLVEAGTGGRGQTQLLRLTVDLVEPLGHEVVIYGKLGDDTLVAKAAPHRAPQIGSELEVAIELDSVHLFDAETERRIDG